MGVRNISTKILKANKDHHDDSYEFIIDSFEYIRNSGRLAFSELRALTEFKANGFKIKKGQLYECQFNEQDGEVYTFKSLPAIVKICQKLDLYQC